MGVAIGGKDVAVGGYGYAFRKLDLTIAAGATTESEDDIAFGVDEDAARIAEEPGAGGAIPA